MDIRQILVSAIYPAGIVMLTSALVAAPHLNGGSDDPRQMASGYWLAAVYGSALVLGLSLAVASRAGSRPKLPGLELMGPLFVAGIWAAVASLAGWVAGNYLANEWMVPPRNPAVVGYWSAHFAGYSAVLVTGLITCWWAWRKRKRAREIEGTIVYHIDRDVSTFRAIKPLADWQNLLVTLAGLLAVVGMVTVLMWRHDISPAIWLALAVAFTLLMAALARKVPWRLVLNVCQFRTHSTPSFDVHYAAELEHGLDWPSFDNQIDAGLSFTFFPPTCTSKKSSAGVMAEQLSSARMPSSSPGQSARMNPYATKSRTFLAPSGTPTRRRFWQRVWQPGYKARKKGNLSRRRPGRSSGGAAGA
jgi:hypothetical protein